MVEGKDVVLEICSFKMSINSYIFLGDIFGNHRESVTVQQILVRFMVILNRLCADAGPLQPPIDYLRLRETGSRRIRVGDGLSGLCYKDGKLFTVEQQRLDSDNYRHSVGVYRAHSRSGKLKLLDRLKLGTFRSYGWRPRVDSGS